MSTAINSNLLKDWIIDKIGGKELEKKDCKDYDIDDKKFAEADDNLDEVLDLDELLDENTEVYEMFATMYTEELEKDNSDPDKAKDEENRVQGTNNNAQA
ncbi:MAG: hypothetical protein MJ237_04505 [bacterium]|nr:hypothetical protein [bacterium]